MSNLLKYDVIYILDPNSSAEDMAAVSTKIEQIVADAKGTVLKKDDWGKRRLAYLVKKHREGHYIFFHLSVTPETVAEIMRNLRLMEKVIKFSVVRDEISHLKAKVKPPRVKTSEGPSNRPMGSRPTGSHSSGSRPPVSSAAPAPAPAAPAPAPEAPSAPPAASNP